jgi:D-alanyl-D-alanine carboxypeptidase
MREDDSFEVASITKTLTATLALQLVEEGALTLDAPLALRAPELFDGLVVVDGRAFGPTLTARQLLGHTSGLPDYWTDPPFVAPEENAFLRAFLADPDRLWAPREVVDYARALRPAGRPGEHYHYSDTGYALLGMVLERITGKPLHALLRDRIFQPLGMNDSYLSYREPAPSARRESARYEDHLDIHRQRRQSADWASGGVVSTTHDLGRFGAALASGACFADPRTASAMRGWHPTGAPDVDYGLGVFRVRVDDQGEMWGHDGHGNAFLYVWPRRRIVFTGTLNQTRNDWWPVVSAAAAAIAHEVAGPPNAGRANEAGGP